MKVAGGGDERRLRRRADWYELVHGSPSFRLYFGLGDFPEEIHTDAAEPF